MHYDKIILLFQYNIDTRHVRIWIELKKKMNSRYYTTEKYVLKNSKTGKIIYPVEINARIYFIFESRSGMVRAHRLPYRDNL